MAAGSPYPANFGDIRDKIETVKIRIRSHAGELPEGTVFSHVSAAIIHGFDPPALEAECAEVVRRGISKVRPTLVIRDREISETDRTLVGDLPVTTIRRTLLDIAYDYPLETSVPIISEALRRGDASTNDLAKRIIASRRGCRDARLALELADARHESAGESLCAVKFHRFGITGMIPQVNTRDSAGRWIARNDFRHEDLDVIVEFHGVGKYYLNAGGPDRASSANHERHMKLLNAGFRVFNLVWADLFRAEPFRQIKAVLTALGG
ncbi:hypothetical protein [Brevibacterium atlanticum]|uniref:hypothetical protein n=1 Tax=Brevibacterium atlanticum TaxID=2697563 RepID=UPI001D18550C|nr:hypothetical protein [Brevibacterium atlanticum]